MCQYQTTIKIFYNDYFKFFVYIHILFNFLYFFKVLLIIILDLSSVTFCIIYLKINMKSYINYK